MYIYDHSGWPRLHWRHDRLIKTLAAVRYQQGRLIGQMEALGFDLRQEAAFETLTEDVLKTSDTDEVLKAGVAHLWFVTLHPFDDGNGRMARAIANMVLARSETSSQRYYSMSSQIRQERAAYYDILERAQKGTTDITAWLAWFLDCLGRAIEGSRKTLATVHNKARFWKRVADVPLNQRQRRVLDRLLGDSEGKLTTSKWAKLAKCSQDTALRDIADLVRRGLLVRNPEGGRSTSYGLADPS